MPRLFGTDGVRGLANGHLTAELALDLSVAAAHVLGRAPATFEGHRPARRRRPGHPDLGAVPRGTRSSPAWPSAGVDVLRLGVLPTPGVAYLTEALGADLGVVHLRLAQPDARQRHQVPRPRRAQARRRRRGRDRAAPRRAVGPPDRRRRRPGHAVRHGRSTEYVATWSAPSTGRSTASRSCSTAPTARPRRRRRSRCATAGAEVVAINAEPDGLNINDGCGSTHLAPLQRGGARARRRRRLRPRRRRRPLPGGRPRAATSSTATRSSRSWRSRMREPRPAAPRTPSSRP